MVERTLFKWERQLLSGQGRWIQRPKLQQQRIDRIIEADIAVGWKQMALFLDVEESTLRRAYRAEPMFRRHIHKTGGRCWANPGELMNLIPEVLNRREGGMARRSYAQARRRGQSSRFAAIRK